MSPLQPDAPLPAIQLATSPYGALLQDSLELVRGLQLPGIDRDKRQLRRVPWDTNLKPPYVTLSLYPEGIDATAGPMGKDEIVYAMMVAAVSSNNGEVGDDQLPVILLWRWELMKAFHRNRSFITSLPDGACSVATEVLPGEPHIPAALRQNFDAQYWLVRFRIWEVRR